MKQILFLGALWGLIEATLGWALHFVHFPAGAVMFPIAMVILMAGYTITGKRSTLLIIGLVAASIKLTNILLPGSGFLFNPTMSIIVEALIMSLLAPFMRMDWAALKLNFLRREVTYVECAGMTVLAIVAQGVL